MDSTGGGGAVSSPIKTEDESTTEEDTVTETVENKMIKTPVVTVSMKNGIKWMIDRDLMSECKECGWIRRYL